MSDADEKLRALAAKATPGPWRFSGAATSGTVGVDNGTFRIADTDLAGIDGAQDDAEFIAAANPVVVLSLLDRLAAVEAERDELGAKLEMPCGSCHACTNWADETWRRAGRKPPTVSDYEATLAGRDQALQALQRTQAAIEQLRMDVTLHRSWPIQLFAHVERLRAAFAGPVGVPAEQPDAHQVTQTLLAGRDDGVPGNCVQAAVASLLGLPIEAVPHFLLWEQWNYVRASWLEERGYALTCTQTQELPPLGRCIAAGMSPRGIRHVCVAEDGRIAWDPHPSGDGLVSVDEIWFIDSAPVAEPLVADPPAAPNCSTEYHTAPNCPNRWTHDPLQRRSLADAAADPQED